MPANVAPMSAAAASTPPSRPGLRQRVAAALPDGARERLDQLAFKARRGRIRALHRAAGTVGFTIARKADYYSTLPVLEDLQATEHRWNRPSALTGLRVDTGAMRTLLEELAGRWEADLAATAGPHLENQRRGFGPGYPHLDARTLYYLLRDRKPRRYLEVGSGLSTYYASLAAGRNEADGSPLQISCIEPHPYDALRTIPGIELEVAEVQEIPLERFDVLEAGDVLFIDSTHALKVDSDVTYLLLEVVPRVAPGVLVHIHDVPFPYNVPFPADTWIFGERWPVYWNEAMAVQAFLAFNQAFEILLSTPILRHEDEGFLRGLFPDYVPVADDPNPPSSLWLRRVA